jgi:hypothetical protein
MFTISMMATEIILDAASFLSAYASACPFSGGSPWVMSATDRYSNEAGRHSACDGGDYRCRAVQIEPEGTRTGRNALNGAGRERCKVSEGEDDNRSRKSWRLMNGAQSSRTAKKQNQAEDRQQLMNDGKRYMEELARKDHANTRHKNGNEEPDDDP